MMMEVGNDSGDNKGNKGTIVALIIQNVERIGWIYNNASKRD